MQQQPPFDSSYGVLRLASARQAGGAVPSPVQATQGNTGGNPAAGVVASTGPSGGQDIVDAQGNPVTPEQLASAQQAAEAGDSNALEWIAGITIGGIAAYSLYKALQGRNRPQVSQGPEAMPLDPSGRAMAQAATPTEYLDWETVPRPAASLDAPRTPQLPQQQGMLPQQASTAPRIPQQRALPAPPPQQRAAKPKPKPKPKPSRAEALRKAASKLSRLRK